MMAVPNPNRILEIMMNNDIKRDLDVEYIDLHCYIPLGTVVRTTEGEYKIKFDDNKEEPLTPAKTKRLFKKKVLRFI